MFLKSLSLQGFKSFADKTTLEFTPGVAVIVGPNGSGKSNLSDAIAWVLGEQGPKTLRGGKMEDVIFAGTPKRNGAGRAEVSLTIDNSAGVLPIEFTEVTITRTIFRGGDSEYAINGTPCRLLDVQELLSDSGIGRELHTIVGQGQLDGVLQARPEERRAYIEEAAGILKYRRRKERAVRKLERTDADIERLGDVIGELRRQIRPLEQQAEMAKRSAEIQADLAEVTLRLWVHDYAAIAEEGDREAEARLTAEAEQLAARLQELAAAIEALENESASSSAAAEAALSTEYRLSSARERVAGLARLADERARHLDELAVRAPEGQAPPPELIAETEAELAAIRVERERAEQQAREAEQEWRALTAAQEAAVKAREEIVHLQGERAALRAAVQAADEERQRLAERRAFLARRRQAREDEIKATADELRVLDDREGKFEAALDEARAALGEAQAAANESAQRLRDLERSADALEARRAVLAEEAARGTPKDLIGRIPGLLGVLREIVRPVNGWERAAQSALEPVAGAIVAARPEDAIQAIRTLKSAGGRGVFVSEGAGAAVPEGIRSAEEAVEQAPDAVRALLRGIALADDLDGAWEIARANPGITVVTRDGDRIAGGVLSGGDPAGLGRDVAAELAAVEAGLRENGERLASARMESERAAAAADEAASRVGELVRQGNEVDAELTGVADHLAELEREDHAAQREDAMMAGRVQEMEERLVSDSEKLSAVESRLSRAVAEERPVIDATQMAAVERRAAERSLHLGGLAERERTVARRVEDLKSRARRIAQEREEWERSREARIAASRKAAAIAAAAVMTRDRLEAWIEEARRARFGVEERRTRCAAELAEARRVRRETEQRAEEVREMAHRTDLARAERSHRLAAMIEKLRAEHDLSPEEAIGRAGTSHDDNVDELRRRASVLERKLNMIGRVNPIAMEQYQGLVDRHAFLTEQVTDLRKSRKDLVSVVEEVDAKIVEMFSAAFEDVKREFEQVFVRLFPGGEGKLALTDPSDLLESGVDVEARPGGKRVKRISLLSGGERSLVAIALLSSIFRARPSPFYLLDEVEAALDDVNLHRFLELVKEFKSASQILIVTHQKRTMEVGDILYGISMGNDGVTRVLAQRFDEPATL
ncbi:MAG TPA: chromosome segregation protein SMC [Actinomycetota bacterium]|nr:chromosome segregation protein SMC [Actinomycetota bacterium]